MANLDHKEKGIREEKNVFKSETIIESPTEFRIDKYEYLRYRNVINELKAVENILKICPKDDKEIIDKYTSIYNILFAELKILKSRLQEKSIKKDQKNSIEIEER